MTKNDILKKISLIGSTGYRDGSSRKGWTYQPIPFKEFEDVPCHMKEVAQFHNELDGMLKRINLKPKTVIDLGCNIGHHCFRLEQKYDSECVGIEADSFNADVANALAEYKGMKSRFFCDKAQDWIKETNARFDLCIFLNSHMWIWKQNPQEAHNVLKWVKENCRFMFFQTAHAKSRGMYLVQDLADLCEVQQYLEGFGFKVLARGVNMIHGGHERGVFFCRS